MKRAIGRSGRTLNPVGLGCMGLTGVYNAALDRNTAIALIHEALDLGADHFDTAEVYGGNHNEALLGDALHDRRGRAFIATKWGLVYDHGQNRIAGTDGSPAACRRAIDGSLKRLKTDHVDLYYLHRIDPHVPVEDSVGAMAELVKAGKVKAIGLSEAGADSIRRAAKVHPIAAVQSEYSIFSRDVEQGPLAAIEDVGASLVAFAPVGRGMLTGTMNRNTVPGEAGDFRQTNIPRFADANYAANIDLVEEIKAVAGELSALPAQVAIAWVLAKSEDIHVIPGTTRLNNLRANLRAAQIVLSPGQVGRLDGLAARVAGQRYSAQAMKSVDR